MATNTPYELSVDGLRGLSVQSIHGVEQLSDPWWFDVVVTSPAGQDIEQGALAKRATLVLSTDEQPRAFYGVVRSVRLEDVLSDGTQKHTLKIVPRLWLLKRKKRTRIFQRMRVTDIVATVLGEAGIGALWQLVRVYPKREYCTQYEETDEQFIRRILAEAGIFYYFFNGGPTSAADEVATVAAVAGAATSLASSTGLVPEGLSAAASLAAGVVPIPGDTFVGIDDSVCYPPMGHDDAASLLAATAACLALQTAEGAGVPGMSVAATAGGMVMGAIAGEAPSLHYAPYDEGSVGHRRKIARFNLTNSVRSKGAVFRDFDPDRPLVRLQSTAVSTAPFPPSPAEIAAIAAAVSSNAVSAVSGGPLENIAPGGGTAEAEQVSQIAGEIAGAALAATVPEEVYEHHSSFLFPKWDTAQDEAPLILRQKRRRASVARGESSCSLLSPGHRFALTGHPAAQLDASYVITRIEHRGSLRQDVASARAYSNTFEAAPASLAFPPPRPKRKSVQVSLTATVVGPGSEEIHVDAKGRIKVQFHWDRQPAPNGESSCWIRVMQPWGGAGWGVQFIPRVGMEVVIGFEGGDPDKPLVMGSVYNGTHPLPFTLPQDKTKSGWRTQSSPGGQGHNELSFDDRAGSEQIYMHAQRDLDEVVLRDHSTRVSGDRTSQIGGDRYDDTAGNARYRIAKERSEEVGESYSLAIGDSRRLSIFGSDLQKVSGSRTTHVKGTNGMQVDGAMSLMVGTKSQPSVAESYIWGHLAVGADGTIALSADLGITLRCGESVIEITKEGIKLSGKTLALEGSKSTTMKGNGPTIALSDEGRIEAKALSIVSEKTSLVMDTEMWLDGPGIKLNCKGIDPTQTDEEGKEPETKKMRVKLTDADANPHASKEYILSAGGARFEGSTDGDGNLEQDVPKDAMTAQITLFVGKRPEGEKLVYRIALEEMPEDSTKSALVRLKNLGYYAGEPKDVLDDAARDAIRRFQLANGLEVTGELDETTLAKLTDVHGH